MAAPSGEQEIHTIMDNVTTSDSTTTTGATGDVMTLPAMAAMARNDLAAVDAATRALAEAERVYGIATLRSMYLSDEAHEVGIRDRQPALHAARRANERAAEVAATNARTIRAQTASARLVVTPDEQIAAVHREPVIRRVVETGTLPGVRDELRASIISADRPACYLFAMLLPARLAAPAPPQEAGRPEVGAARSDLQRMLGQIRDELRDPAFGPIRKLADDVLERAGAVSAAAFTRQSDARLNEQVERGEKVRWPT